MFKPSVGEVSYVVDFVGPQIERRYCEEELVLVCMSPVPTMLEVEEDHRPDGNFVQPFKRCAVCLTRLSAQQSKFSLG